MTYPNLYPIIFLECIFINGVIVMTVALLPTLGQIVRLNTLCSNFSSRTDMFCSTRFVTAVILSNILLAVASFVIVTETRADEPTGWYAAISGGPTLFTDSDLNNLTRDNFGNAVDSRIETDFDTGFNIQGAVGYDLGPIRLEAEGGFRKVDVDSTSFKSITVAGIPVGASTLNTINGAVRASGDMTALSAMVNGWYDIELGGKWSKWLPYIGGGVGVAIIDVDLKTSGEARLFGPSQPPTNLSDSARGDDTVLAYHAGAGLGYRISDAMTVIVGYRYFGTSDVKFKSRGDRVKAETDSHNVEIGLRFRF